MNGQHRSLELQPDDLGAGAALPGQIPPPPVEMEDIGGGTTHVEANDGLGRQAREPQGPLGHGHRPHHAAGRPREDRVLGQQLLGIRQGSAGTHHPQPGCWPQGQLHLAQVAPQHRRHRRLHQGGLTAGHQPGLAAEPVGEHHRPKTQGRKPIPQPLLMAGIAGAVQQGNGAAAEAVGLGTAQRLAQLLRELQGLELGAVNRQAPIHLQHPHPQGLGPLDRQGKKIGAVLIADAEQVGKAAVDQQHHASATLLQQGIGGHGGAQAHLLHQALRHGLARRQAQHGPDRLHRRVARAIGLHRQHLAHHQLTGGAAAHHIGEGAAPVDPEPPTGGWAGRLHWLSGNSQTGAAPPRPGP